MSVLGRFRRRSYRELVVSISPDWVDSAGHFGAWEHRVHRISANQRVEMFTLAHCGLEPMPDFARPVFSRPFFPVQSIGEVKHFEDELRAGLRSHVGDRPAAVIFYAGSLLLLPAVLTVAAEFPRIRFTLNAMRSHTMLFGRDPFQGGSSAEFTKRALKAAADAGVRVTADSEKLNEVVQERFGLDLEPIPMSPVTDPSLLKPRIPQPGGPIRVIAPGYPQAVRGFDSVAQLSEHLSSRIADGSLSMTARYTWGRTPELDDHAKRLLDNGATLIEGHSLSPSDYAEMIRDADVALLPYRKAAFQARTSGVLLDLLATGVPVVATANSWSGCLLSTHGIGRTFPDRNAAAMCAAIDAVIADFESEADAVVAAWSRIEQEYRTESLVDFLTVPVTTGAPLSIERLDDLYTSLSLLLGDLFFKDSEKDS